jgi:glutamine synthetase adenylyltransferase
MARDVILQRGSAVKRDDIRTMRARIIKELSSEEKGFDIKLGPGGTEDMEFYVQFLQLQNASRFPDVLVQNTLSAINRLAKKELLPSAWRDTLNNTYQYCRKLQTFLRLNEEEVISENSEVTELAAKFMDHRSKEDFFEHLREVRDGIKQIINTE